MRVIELGFEIFIAIFMLTKCPQGEDLRALNNLKGVYFTDSALEAVHQRGELKENMTLKLILKLWCIQHIISLLSVLD